MPSKMDAKRARVEKITRLLLSRLHEDLDELKAAGFGVAVFAFDLGDTGALAYISTAERADVVRALGEWMAYQMAGLVTEPPGDRGQG